MTYLEEKMNGLTLQEFIRKLEKSKADGNINNYSIEDLKNIVEHRIIIDGCPADRRRAYQVCEGICKDCWNREIEE